MLSFRCFMTTCRIHIAVSMFSFVFLPCFTAKCGLRIRKEALRSNTLSVLVSSFFNNNAGNQRAGRVACRAGSKVDRVWLAVVVVVRVAYARPW